MTGYREIFIVVLIIYLPDGNTDDCVETHFA